ncbi:gliding motility lipoprotein GldD [Aureispira anguillae]|uniref:Gliding motility protein GldD n=1 Tax=Aureispira anguillae TaxID=2864201 RepID=A0A916DW01_9BACT|nr:gliding motility protein GldD [Aureispira anguillae]BDS14140.1 gliding motility protein GldD [Aureispira anguillae]
MRIFFSIIFLSLVFACTEERIPIPKPRIYPKVIYPERNYIAFDKNYCAFSFDYPDYMKFEQDSLLVNRAAKHPCWFTMNIPALNGSVHFTYTDISGDSVDQKLYDVINDSYTLSEKHNSKASGRFTEPFILADQKIFGITYHVDGNVASPYHFMLTDSIEHAIWGSLYFNTKPNADSMAPVVAFVKEDLEKVIHTLKWNEE